MHLVKAPWIRPGVVVHDPSDNVDHLLADFARSLTERGFRVEGFVQRNNRRLHDPGEGCADRIELLELGSGTTRTVEGGAGSSPAAAAVASLRSGLRDDVDLVVISRFSAFENAAKRLMTMAGDGPSQGLPVLTSVAGRCLDKWYRLAGTDGAMLSPSLSALWRWWGAERLYPDLVQGVASLPVRRIVCGPRWVMVEGPHGAGLAALPKAPGPLPSRLPAMRRMTLRALAALTQSWNALEMAVGIAAVNAHYNRFDLDLPMSNGAHAFLNETGRVMVIGAFPGLSQTLPQGQVIEAQPRPGELPSIAMDTVLPGAAAVVVSATSIVNRTLPRILRLSHGARIALAGAGAPMSARLHAYGVEIIGGLRVRDPDGLAEVVAAGGLPRDFEKFGDFVHLREAAPQVQAAAGVAVSAPMACRLSGERPRAVRVPSVMAGGAC